MFISVEISPVGCIASGIQVRLATLVCDHSWWNIVEIEIGEVSI